jgi:GTPase SAR1 family protein
MQSAKSYIIIGTAQTGKTSLANKLVNNKIYIEIKDPKEIEPNIENLNILIEDLNLEFLKNQNFIDLINNHKLQNNNIIITSQIMLYYKCKDDFLTKFDGIFFTDKRSLLRYTNLNHGEIDLDIMPVLVKKNLVIQNMFKPYSEIVIGISLFDSDKDDIIKILSNDQPLTQLNQEMISDMTTLKNKTIIVKNPELIDKIPDEYLFGSKYKNIKWIFTYYNYKYIPPSIRMNSRITTFIS